MRDMIYGLDSGKPILPNETVTLSQNSQVRHRPIALGASDVGHFEIIDVMVGRASLLEHDHEKRAATLRWDAPPPGEEERFTTKGWLYFWKKLSAEVGHDFSITVKNVSTSSRQFVASVIGRELPSVTELEQRIELLEKALREKVL